MTTKKDLTPKELDALWAKLQSELPEEGRTEVGQRAPSHNWDEQPYVAGVVKTKEHATIDGDDREVMEVKTVDGVVAVWNNAMLQRAFDTVKVGQSIAILYTGTRKLEGGRTLREFKVAIGGKSVEG